MTDLVFCFERVFRAIYAIMSDSELELNPPAAEAPKDSLATILDEIRQSEKRMERRLKQLESDVQRSQEEAVEKAAKKARRDRSFTFRRKAHREQFEFNERVAECLEKATDEVAKRPVDATSLDKAKAALDQGLELLASRQKLIKIADRSEFGWKVVAEYEADELASDSEDEKKLEKAERNAERKATKKRKAATRPNGRIFNKSRQPPAGSFESTPWFRPAGYQAVQPTPGRGQLPVPKPPPSVGPCFSCGEMGHLKRFCPKLVPGATRWYPVDAATESMIKKNAKGSANGVRCSSVQESVRRRLHDDASYEYGDFCIRLHRGDAAFTPIRFHQKRCTLL